MFLGVSALKLEHPNGHNGINVILLFFVLIVPRLIAAEAFKVGPILQQ